MKKTKIFLTAMILGSACMNSYGQLLWDGSASVRTSTLDEVRIGISAPALPAPPPPQDAWLHIYDPYVNVPCPGGGGTAPSSPYPELWIERQICPSCMVPVGCGAPQANILQITNTGYYMGGGWASTTLDVIDHNGWLGVLTPNPVQPLDVKGNGNISGILSVQGGLINMASPVDASFRSIQAQSPKHGIQVCANSATNNGSSIQINGADTYGGLISYSSYGTQGMGHQFLNYDIGSGVWHPNMVINNTGQTLIGHDLWSGLPGDVLTVKDQLGFSSANPRIHGNTDNGVFMIRANASSGSDWDGPGVELWGGHSARDGQISSYSYTAPGSPNYYGHMFLNYNPSNPAPNDFHANMCINKDGTVVIGNELIYSYSVAHPAVPGDYLLYVQHGILTEKLKVAVWGDVNWSDFVFNEDYKLPALCDIESYIQSNKHLPEVPSAKDVAADGIDVASMDAKLLQKIEELTLYAIEQQKEINELKTQMKNKTK